MATDYIPRKDMLALIYCTTLANAMAVDAARYGVGAEEVAALQAQLAEFGASLQRVDRLSDERAAEVERKKKSRRDVEASVRGLVGRVHANREVTDDVKAEAGIPVHDRVRSHLSPLVPTDLGASADINGVHHLKWKAGDLGRGTQYVIEARSGAATEFTQLDVVLAPRYKHRLQQLGVPVIYRVRARRSGKESAASNEAGVYLVTE